MVRTHLKTIKIFVIKEFSMTIKWVIETLIFQHKILKLMNLIFLVAAQFMKHRSSLHIHSLSAPSAATGTHSKALLYANFRFQNCWASL